MRIPRFTALVVFLFAFALASPCSAAEKIYAGKPIRALIITGGCCHNYKFQAEAMTNGIGKQAGWSGRS